MKRYVNKKVWWNIYIIKLENDVGFKYYTGITQDIGRRLGDYLFRRGKGYVNTTMDSRVRTPVFVSRFLGNEVECMRIERRIKRMNVVKKELLIGSVDNLLVGYKPLKHVILSINDGEIVREIR